LSGCFLRLQGKSSLEAVQLVADLVKTRKCSVPPLVVSCLLVLRFEQVTPVSAGGEGAGGGKAKKVRGMQLISLYRQALLLLPRAQSYAVLSAQVAMVQEEEKQRWVGCNSCMCEHCNDCRFFLRAQCYTVLSVLCERV
jgi:hypothetical protein